MSSQQFPSGTKIGMFFDLAAVEPTYGTADKLSGVVPLLLPYGEFIEPTIVSKPALLESMAAQNFIDYRDLWVNELDEVVHHKMRDGLLYIAYINPQNPVEAKEARASVLLGILSGSMDDVLDTLGEMEALHFADIKKMTTFLTNLFAGKFKSVDELPNPIEVLSCFNLYIFKFVQLCEECIPNFYSRNKEFVREFINIMYGYVLLMENRDEFSAVSRTVFRSYCSGVSGGLEFIALCRNLTISQEIRDDILFQRMTVAYGSATDFMNDVFGLGRDIRKNQVNDSSILTEVVANGVPLQEAFDKALEELCHVINDIKVAAKKLRQVYPGDADFEDYLGCVERLVDGQIYWYAQAARYGKTTLKIVEIIPD